jgi:hypothetical protein
MMPQKKGWAFEKGPKSDYEIDFDDKKAYDELAKDIKKK